MLRFCYGYCSLFCLYFCITFLKNFGISIVMRAYACYNSLNESERKRDNIMGHCIDYIVADKNVDKKAIIADICDIVEQECWREGGGYSGRMTWHDGMVYADYDEAVEAIDRFDRGFYDDHAVLFREVGDLENATTRRLVKQIADTQLKMRDYIATNHVKDRKSALIGCPHCGSKLSREYLYSDSCPLCHADLRSDTVKKRIKGYETKIAEWEKKMREEKKKLGAKAPVKWLVKYEYHI